MLGEPQQTFQQLEERRSPSGCFSTTTYYTNINTHGFGVVDLPQILGP